MHLSLSPEREGEKKLPSPFAPFWLSSPFCNSPPLSHPSYLFRVYFWCNLVITWSSCTAQTHTAPFVLGPGQVCFLGCPGGSIRWPGSPERTPGHQGGLCSPHIHPLPTPTLPPSSSTTSFFQVPGQGQSFEDAFPRLHHEAGWRRCALLSNQHQLHPVSHIRVLSHIHFISSSFYCNQ